MFAWNYCVELFARIQKKASGAYLMRRPRPFCMDQTAEIGGVVCSCALRSRALRISIARCNNCSNSQRSIRGPVSRTFRLCVTVTEICSSVGKLQCSKFTKHPLQKNCRTLSSAPESEIVSALIGVDLGRPRRNCLANFGQVYLTAARAFSTSAAAISACFWKLAARAGLPMW
jgi:hypothetical protein